MLLPKRLLLAGLCAGVSLGVLTYGDDRQPRKSRLAPVREHVLIFGQKVKLPPDPIPTGLAQDRADQAKVQDEHWAAMENEYVQDPCNPVTSSLPNPPGVQLVRTVLNQWQPAPRATAHRPLVLVRSLPISRWRTELSRRTSRAAPGGILRAHDQRPVSSGTYRLLNHNGQEIAPGRSLAPL